MNTCRSNLEAHLLDRFTRRTFHNLEMMNHLCKQYLFTSACQTKEEKIHNEIKIGNLYARGLVRGKYPFHRGRAVEAIDKRYMRPATSTDSFTI